MIWFFIGIVCLLFYCKAIEAIARRYEKWAPEIMIIGIFAIAPIIYYTCILLGVE